MTAAEQYVVACRELDRASLRLASAIEVRQTAADRYVAHLRHVGDRPGLAQFDELARGLEASDEALHDALAALKIFGDAIDRVASEPRW